MKENFSMINFFRKLFPNKKSAIPSGIAENKSAELNQLLIPMPHYIIVRLTTKNSKRMLYLGFKKAFKPEDERAIFSTVPEMPNFVWIDKRPLACEFVARDEAQLFVEKCLSTLKEKIVIVPIFNDLAIDRTKGNLDNGNT